MFPAVMAAAKLYSARPSALLAIPDPVLALAVDLAAAERAMGEPAQWAGPECEDEGSVEKLKW
jgi:hypothetical protein